MIAGLILKVGVPFVTDLMAKIEKKEHVTPEEWRGLLSKIDKSFDSFVPEAKV